MSTHAILLVILLVIPLAILLAILRQNPRNRPYKPPNDPELWWWTGFLAVDGRDRYAVTDWRYLRLLCCSCGIIRLAKNIGLIAEYSS